jgi:hypothetical protein
MPLGGVRHAEGASLDVFIECVPGMWFFFRMVWGFECHSAVYAMQKEHRSTSSLSVCRACGFEHVVFFRMVWGFVCHSAVGGISNL